MKRSIGVSLHQEAVSQTLSWWIISLLICAMLFGVDKFGWLAGLRGVGEGLSLKVDKKVEVVSSRLKKPWNQIESVFTRKERLARLEQQLALAAVDQQRLHQLESKVAALESMVARGQSGNLATMLAEMTEVGGKVVVNVGSEQGLVEGQLVTDSNRVLVGRIGTVGRYMSQVELVGEGDFKIPVTTVSQGARGVIRVEARGELVMAEILQTEGLSVGEVVVAAADAGIGSGWVVGQVEAVEVDPAAVTKKAKLTRLSAHQGWAAIW